MPAAQAQAQVAQTQPTSSKKPILSNLDMEVYGFVYGQASYDSKPINEKDSPTYPMPPTGDSGDSSQLSGTVKRTRLGIKISGPEVCEGKTSALVEGDFWGDPSPTTTDGTETSHGSIKPRLRHGYIKWTREGWSVLAGQTWDLVGNIMPSVLNFNNLLGSGQLGIRHAQVRVGKTFEIDKSRSFLLEGALSRPAYSRTGTPHFQYNVAYFDPLFCEKPCKFSFSGVFGKEKVTSERYKVWVVNPAMNLPLNKWLAITVSAFTGSNLKTYYGGINQDVNANLRKAVRAHGGFAQVTITPVKKWEWNLGYGVDKAKDEDLSNYGTDANPGTSRKKNENYYTNLKYFWTESFWVGIELAHMKISYKGIDRKDKNDRVELGVCYSF